MSKQVDGKNLRKGSSKSCGCAQFAGFDAWNAQEHQRAVENPREYKRPEAYAVWLSMKDRCYNPNNKTFQHYGGRGITVSDEWRGSFDTFIRDMGPRPGPGYQIDRANNDDGYHKDNCSWVPQIVNANNKRSSRFVEHDGRRMTLSQWSRETGLGSGVIRNRIEQGWPVRDALTLPVGAMRARGRPVEFDGRSQTIGQWATEVGIGANVIRQRLDNGWTAKDALTTPHAFGKKTSPKAA